MTSRTRDLSQPCGRSYLAHVTLQDPDHISEPSGPAMGGAGGALPDHLPEPGASAEEAGGAGRGGWHWSCRLFLLSPQPIPMEVVPRGECKKECLFKLLPAQSWRLETRCTPDTGSAVDKTHLCMSGGLVMSTLWTRDPRGTKPKKRPINVPTRWDKIQNSSGVHETECIPQRRSQGRWSRAGARC